VGSHGVPEEGKLKSSNIIMVVAGGHSVSMIDKSIRDNLVNEACVIGVNDSALYMPVDYAITMDRIWLEKRYVKMRESGTTTYYRACTTKNGEFWARVGGRPQQPQFMPYFGNISRAQMTTDPGHLWGDNSGKVALNLAYQLGPKRVFMLGFDLKLGADGEQHWYPAYPWGGGAKQGSMKGWAASYDYIADQFQWANIELRNVATPSTTLIPPEKIKRLSVDKFNKGAWKEKLRA
jgi:hypothetical protein